MGFLTHKSRLKLGVALSFICLSALVAVVQMFIAEYKHFKILPDVDQITFLEEKILRIQPLLIGQDVIGYESDRRHDAFTLGVLRYALAPRIITPKGQQTVVIGNYGNHANLDKFIKKNNMEIKKKIYTNIYLFKKRNE